eukprot:jgi/Botrbrau1/18707/Bobra.0386s0033.1
MASAHRPLWGPYTKHGCAKSIYKGEDTCSQHPGTKVDLKGCQGGPLLVDVFGIFDGHGGKDAAVYTSKHLFHEVLACLPDHLPEDATQHIPPDVKSTAHVPEEAWDQWKMQDRLMGGLAPAVLSAFNRINDKFISMGKPAGTTATLAVLVGWELLVANVGDSCAYLDTGSEIIQISGNHRLDGNRAEIERCEAAGCKVSPSLLEGKPVGPLRVWPGGLAMSRTLGDADAGPVVLADPEVRQVTIPAKGARLIIASDGLWDAVHYKTACHHVRGQTATKAAHALVQQALKSRGLRDDVSIVVLDVLPDQNVRLPPLLEKSAGAGSHPEQHVQLYHPLDDRDELARLKHTWERRREALRQLTGGSLEDAPLLESGSESSSCTHLCSMAACGGPDEMSPDSPIALIFGSFGSDTDCMDLLHTQDGNSKDAGWEVVTPRKSKRDPACVAVPEAAVLEQPRAEPLVLPGAWVPQKGAGGRRVPFNGKRHSRRYDGSTPADVPLSPAQAKGKKPSLPGEATHITEVVTQDQQPPLSMPAHDGGPVGPPLQAPLAVSEPGLPRGHNRGFRNRRGREDWGSRGQHPRAREGHPSGAPGQEKIPGGHRRPQRRHVGFNPAEPPGPQGRPSWSDPRSENPQSTGGLDYVTGTAFGDDLRRSHPPKTAMHRPRRSGLSGIGRQGGLDKERPAPVPEPICVHPR